MTSPVFFLFNFLYELSLGRNFKTKVLIKKRKTKNVCWLLHDPSAMSASRTQKCRRNWSPGNSHLAFVKKSWSKKAKGTIQLGCITGRFFLRVLNHSRLFKEEGKKIRIKQFPFGQSHFEHGWGSDETAGSARLQPSYITVPIHLSSSSRPSR